MDLSTLRTQITKFIQPSDTEWNEFSSKLRTRHLAKNEVYLAEGQTCRNVGLITKGALRMYYLINGEERCKDFQFEGQFTGSIASLATQQPSKFSIAALEDSTLAEISYADLQQLYDKYKSFERLGRLYITQMFIYKEKREASLLFDSSSTRYQNLLAEQPLHTQRIPLKYLASYLGIKPESLSRIRKEATRKK